MHDMPYAWCLTIMKMFIHMCFFLWVYLYLCISFAIIYNAESSIFVLENANCDVNFSCPANTSSVLKFKVSVFIGQEINLGECQTTCFSLAPKTQIIKNLNSFDIHFQTSSVEKMRTMSYVNCIFDGKDTYFNISVLAQPVNSSCDSPKLTVNNTDVSLTCKTPKVFPQAKCFFQFANQTSIEHGTITYDHQEYRYSSQNLVYYMSQCTWTSPLSNFDAGYYNFLVSILPNVTDNLLYGQNVTTNSTLNLTIPTVQISQECYNGSNVVNGYIKPNTNLNCTCSLENIGNPPGSIKWINSSNYDDGKNINSSFSSLYITSLYDKNQYTCISTTILRNKNSSKSYTVKYAKGPTKCFMKLEDTSQTVWNMCRTAFINFTTYCQANLSDVVPGIQAQIGLNSVYGQPLEVKNVSNLYQIQNVINITNSGRHVIGCQVQNIYFNDLSATCSLQALEVMAPPETPPILQIRNYTVGIYENEVYYIECKAPGGFPNISNLTLSCGNITESTQLGNIFTSFLSFSRNMTRKNCTCTAQHITGCYENNISTMKTNILYQSAVTFFEANSTIIENGTYAQLLCTADGNPPPNISISKGSEIVAVNSSGYFLLLNKSLSCKDAGYYFCRANNGIDFNNKDTKQATFFVKCPLQFTSFENFKNFTLLPGNIFFYNISLYGYPEPDNFTVFKSNTETKKIIVTKLSMEPPYTTVEMKSFSLTSEDFDNYTLFIFQDGFKILSFNFSISKGNENILQKPMEETQLIVAATCGSLAACCLIFLLLISSICLYRRGKFSELKKLDTYTIFEIFTEDTRNIDIYFTGAQIKENQKKVNIFESETYKNYTDVIPTITSATAVPKNMYKPEVKPKSKISNSTGYYNFVEPLIQLDKKELLDESVYANQGYDPNTKDTKSTI